MGELLESPQLPSQLLLVDMLVLADMLPTLPELSMLPRDLLMLSQRLMLMLLSSTELMDMVDTVLDMPDTDMELTHMPMVDMDTHMPMELTTERDLLMLSRRLMLSPLRSLWIWWIWSWICRLRICWIPICRWIRLWWLPICLWSLLRKEIR